MEGGGCCPYGSWPALHNDHQVQGTVLDIGGTKVYHTGLGNRVIIIFSDVFGAFSGRHQAVADTFANLGYNVYIPQFLDPPYAGPVDFALMGANVKGQSQNKIQQIFQQTLSHSQKQGVNKYFVIGFCWGGWEALKMSVKFQGISSVVGFHPSLQAETFLGGGSQVELVKSLKAPAFLIPAGNDPPNIKAGGQITKVLEDKFGSEKAGTYQFPDMLHGWVVRGDLNNDNVKRDVQAALELAHNYFHRF